MSKKDYELIAAAIASEKTAVEALERSRSAIANAISYRIQQSNPRFDAARFLKACNV